MNEEAPKTMLQATNAAITENPMLALVVFLVASIFSNTGFQHMFPSISRSDPFTGAQGQILADRIEAVNEASEMRHMAQEERLDEADKLNALDKQHRIEAIDGYRRMRVMEATDARQTQALMDVREELKGLRSDIRGLLSRLIEVEK